MRPNEGELNRWPDLWRWGPAEEAVTSRERWRGVGWEGLTDSGGRRELTGWWGGIGGVGRLVLERVGLPERECGGPWAIAEEIGDEVSEGDAEDFGAGGVAGIDPVGDGDEQEDLGAGGGEVGFDFPPEDLSHPNPRRICRRL